MQFAEVKFNTAEVKWCFALSKWEATAFVTVGKNQKAPDDEQAVRFTVLQGRPVVWISDGTQMLYLVPRVDVNQRPHDGSVATLAASLKSFAAKCRVNQMLLFPVGAREVYLAGARDLSYSADVSADVEELGALARTPSLTWGVEQLTRVSEVVLRAVGAGAPPDSASWETSGRFSVTMGAVGKATDHAACSWITGPVEGGPLVVRTRHPSDGSAWTLAVMPRQAEAHVPQRL